MASRAHVQSNASWQWTGRGHRLPSRVMTAHGASCAKLSCSPIHTAPQMGVKRLQQKQIISKV
ncbi:hypothetical protein [Brucella rhizosphaerae]|uniref:hypothetical protein n=1 Tax=Brucella rhizosphaerae TaxID=571254 RepID=UPI000688862A|nr:hypothetical protein [Brucella rhizosphaerae]